MNRLIKKSTLAAALSFILPTTAMAEIVITEYVEGNDRNRVLEITNMGSADIDMGAESYRLGMYPNGEAAEDPGRGHELTGVLAAGASYVLYNADAAPQFQFPNQGAVSNITFFNGNDTLVLVKGGVIIDSLGKIGEDPFSGGDWSDSNNPDFSTVDKTLRRLASVTSGDADANDAFPGSPNQWVVFDIDTANGLGCGGEGACEGGTTPPPTEPPPPPTEPLPTGTDIVITEYIEGTGSNGNNKAVEISNLSPADIDMGAGAYKLAMFSNGSPTEHEERKIELTGVLAAGASFVIYNEQADAEFIFPEGQGAVSPVTFFNGNDALVLTKGGTVIDSFGQVGDDPDVIVGWTDPNNPEFSTVEKTLRRLNSVNAGDVIVDDAFPGSPNQWAVFPLNTADGLGCPGEAACGGTTTPEPEPEDPSPVVITEYIEGSSSNKAIEITNFSDDDIDMGEEGYKLVLFGNGSTDQRDDRTLELTGVLFARSTYVVYNDGAAAEFLFPQQGESSSVTFYNGDDALVLFKNDTVVDSFGQVGVDPGREWLDDNNENFSTREKTLRRRADITVGDTIMDDAFPGAENQWVVFDQNTADGLGCSGEVACAPSANVIISEYIEGSGNNKVIEISNFGTTNVDLHEEGFRLSVYANGRITRSGTEKLYGILVPGSSLVVYNAGSWVEEFNRPAPQGIASNVTFFNGDDALVLTTNGQVVDSFGQHGVRPDRQWTDANDSNFGTQNKTLRRADGIVTGDTFYADEFPGEVNQWVAFESNTSDGVGCAGESACTGSEPLPLEGEGAPLQIGLCQNCPDITVVNELADFVDAEYYAEAASVSIEDLPAVLQSKISTGHVQLSYSEVWSVITFADEDPANADNVIEIYTGNSIAKWLNASGNQSPNPNAWNREHVWSKSHGFPDIEQMAFTDAHHLRPADASMNTTRSNLDFDVGGEPIEESPINFKDDDSFEPRDDVKGDVARMMFYMASRYNGAEADNTPDLTLVDLPVTESGSATFGNLCTLYSWHLNDPVDESERVRNDVIYQYQGNRNPYIDHPRWANLTYGTSCGFVPTLPEISITSPSVVSEGQTVTLDAAGTTDADGDELTYHWVQTTDAFLSFQFDAQTLSFTAPNVSSDTPVSFVLTVSDGRHQVTQEVNFVIEDKSSSGGGIGGGALGWLTVLLLPLVGIRRRKAIVR